jgi:pSer/pThr/pTyr-binding forkhead associated (FHA) protein
VIEGNDRGRSLAISPREAVVGTGAGCDLTLTDSRVSAYHLTISQDYDGAIIVRDKGSTNGTWYQGKRVQEQVVPLGASFLVGKTAVRVEPDAPMPAALHDTERTLTPTGPITVRSDLPYAEARLAVLADFERTYLAEVLQGAQGDLGVAARAAGIDVERLRAMLHEYGLPVYGPAHGRDRGDR